jgi:hypothetical protein
LAAVLDRARATARTGTFLQEALQLGPTVACHLPVDLSAGAGSVDLAQLEVLGPVRQVLGLSADALRQMGPAWEDHVHPEDRAVVRAAWERLQGGADRAAARIRLTGEAGQERWLQAQVRLVRSRAGAALQGLLTDVSESVVLAGVEAQVARLHEIISHRQPGQAMGEVGDLLLDVLDVDVALVGLQRRNATWQEPTVVLAGARPAAPEGLAAWAARQDALTGCDTCLERAFRRGGPERVPEER